MNLNCKLATQVRSGGGGCCECFADAIASRCSSLENRKQYIRLLNSIYTPEGIGV